MTRAFRWHVIAGFACVVAVLGCASLEAQQTALGDAFVRFDSSTVTWTLGTSSIEEELQLSGGVYRLVRLENKLTHSPYVPRGGAAEQFRITVEDAVYTGASGIWVLKDSKASVVGDGQVQLVVRLENQKLQVDRIYIVYAHTGIIRQWQTIRNVSQAAIKVADPYFLADRLRLHDGNGPVLNYMTGGGYFTGSQVLKQVPLSENYSRIFDSTDKPEVEAINGVRYGYPIPYGAGAYLQWFCIRDAAAAGGLFVGFDYWGRWAAQIGKFFGAPGFLGLRVAGCQKSLAPNESITTPMAFTGVFGGDLDSMGKELNTWQYRYLWDYTSDEYFAKIRYGAEMRWQRGKGEVGWGGGTQDNWDYRMAALFHAADVMRYVGADVLWQDAGWHDLVGDNDGPDFARVKEYLNKSGMGLAIRWPLYTVSDRSRVYREHPDWRTSLNGSDVHRIEDVAAAKTWISEPGSGGANLDTSRADVIDYLHGQLDDTVAKWGDYQWRLDGTSVVPVNKDETPMLAQHWNMFDLMERFRRDHPHSSIDVCAGGGNLMGFETARVSDVVQLTDGGSLYNANYYSSYLFPPDKIDDWTRDSNFTWEFARSALTMAPAWMGDRGLYGHEPGLLLNEGMENLRRTFEIYHYLVQQGVAGRWSLGYHPKVEGDDPVFYFQRLSQDGKRGAIILKHFPGGDVKVFPKGLTPQQSYDVRFAMSKKTGVRTGSDLMTNGIALTDMAPGELIFLGLPNYPGSGLDDISPTDPAQVIKKIATNMGVTGVEIAWQPSTDNNWLSYYQVYCDGKMIDKVSKGHYYFDHSAGPENLSAQYAIEAIDGDGNASRRIIAAQVAGAPIVYTAEGGFLSGKDYSYQGANGWRYQEWTLAGRADMVWNGNLGEMGLYRGVMGIGTEKSLIGASWMKPGYAADAVRTFTVPYAGTLRITGAVHKDIYHPYGDGVRVKILQNDRQIWPDQGWVTIAGSDATGKDVDVSVTVHPGDRLNFVVNCNANSVDDDTVWNPRIEYGAIQDALKRPSVVTLDENNSFIKYAGAGWQELGHSPWHGDVDQGYLPGWFNGSLIASNTAGDEITFKFHGTGAEIIGQTGTDRGIATIELDGKPAGIIDTFVPENLPARTVPEVRAGSAALWANAPATHLWAVRDLPAGDHTITLTVSGRKNDDSTGIFIGIDAIEVVDGSLVDASGTH